MPKAIPDIEGFKFSFWSNENDEPIHVHVYKTGAGAKFWIQPEIRLAWNKGFTQCSPRPICAFLAHVGFDETATQVRFVVDLSE